MKIAIVSYPGSHGVDPLRRAVTALGVGEVSVVSDRTDSLGEFDVLFLPGGASYADYLRPGALAKASRISGQIKKAVDSEKRVIGIGNGFQILCEMDLLPGVFLQNPSMHLLAEETRVSVANPETIFTKGLKKQTYQLPLACWYGNYFLDSGTHQELEEEGQIALRYCDSYGDPIPDGEFHNFRSSIAGVFNRKKTTLGLLPHPERAVPGVSENHDGMEMLLSFLGAA